MELWLDLAEEFGSAHARPVQREFICAVWEYAAWCASCGEPDVENAVGCAFLEHLPGDARFREEAQECLQGESLAVIVDLLDRLSTERGDDQA